jgi:hypothetical protein
MEIGELRSISMRTIISRWFMFGLLLGWSLTHATVFGQTGKTAEEPKATPFSKIRAGLDKSVTVDFTGQSLVDVLNHFRDKVGVPINVDPVVFGPMAFNPGDPMGGAQITIKGTNEKASTILRRTLSAQRLSYVILEDGVLITSEDAAVHRQMRQRVSLDLTDVPLKKAARELARNHGVSLVIDPKVAKDTDTSVSLQVDDTTLETALRLMAEMADLKAVRMGNVIMITTETRAKKIREEEQNQNSFNPMLNQVFPQGVVGGFGFGGGGFGGVGRAIALPARGVAAPGLPPGVPMQAEPPVQIDPAPPVPGVKPVAPPKPGTTAPAPPPPPPPAVQRPDQPVQSPPRRPE